MKSVQRLLILLALLFGSAGCDRPTPGPYPSTVSPGTETIESDTVARVIEVEDWIEYPKCKWEPFLIGELIDEYIDEIKDFHASVTMVEWNYVPGAGNAGTLQIHCLNVGVAPGTAVVVISSTMQVVRVNFTIDCTK